ncbi:N-acyl-phosphatidylethanolamine-hydrolyzing phospholipase D-like isoform X1 [Mizuhopecten yessoensis]|uniref:N-acyl-phosphatidylethanolamine-hydrolyzing phospholipase D-like isoform X1 n=1 Tax=Mizuhopecten yessoensis TaxID=6573 RepID=UPI000B45BD49|nr:N-acyl-phosphatidylethanolamine-hydrolyzing phospholipase D-like isoform X1 [Mizuhopecten yessoensis]
MTENMASVDTTENMASVNTTDSRINKSTRTKPLCTNGVYKNPWKTWKDPDFVLKFMYKMLIAEKDCSNIPCKTQELDKHLPVLTPEFDQLENPPNSGVQATWIGHASVLVQLDGITVLTDPIFSDRCSMVQWLGPKRYRPPPCKVDDLTVLDAVVISHNHYDHLDHGSVVSLNRKFGDKLWWYVPIGTRQWMLNTGCKNVVELSWWEEHQHSPNPNIMFALTPAQHWCKRTATDTNKVSRCQFGVTATDTNKVSRCQFGVTATDTNKVSRCQFGVTATDTNKVSRCQFGVTATDTNKVSRCQFGVTATDTNKVSRCQFGVTATDTNKVSRCQFGVTATDTNKVSRCQFGVTATDTNKVSRCQFGVTATDTNKVSRCQFGVTATDTNKVSRCQFGVTATDTNKVSRCQFGVTATDTNKVSRCQFGVTATDTNKALWGSWVVKGPKHSFFFAGDTAYCEGFKEIGEEYGPFDLSAIPIGAYAPRSVMAAQHVDPAEAVQIHTDVKSRNSLGIHWGTFKLTYEFYLEPQTRLPEELRKADLSEDCFVTLKHGETRIFGE